MKLKVLSEDQNMKSQIFIHIQNVSLKLWMQCKKRKKGSICIVIMFLDSLFNRHVKKVQSESFIEMQSCFFMHEFFWTWHLLAFLGLADSASWLDTVQDFSIKLGIKACLHIHIENKHVIVRPTKIMNNLLKVCKICIFKVICLASKINRIFVIFFL